MTSRIGDTKKSWFRSERVFYAAEGWWFSSRENSEEGPYESIADAEAEVLIYLRNIHLAQSNISDTQGK